MAHQHACSRPRFTKNEIGRVSAALAAATARWAKRHVASPCGKRYHQGMSPIPLIPQQFPAVDARDADPPRVVDPRTNEVYVLVPEADFESVQDLLEEERRLRTIHAIGRRNAAGRMEDDA